MSEIKMDVGSRPKLDWIDVTLVDVDHNYQREVDGKSVAKILSNFRWDHFGAVVLAPKPDGRFNVTDGQHRVKAALLHPEVSHIPAMIVDLDGTAKEAENFLVINRGRRSVNTIEIYWAGLASQDPHTLQVKAVLDQAGCEVCAAHGDYRVGHTMAVTAIGRSISRYGAEQTIDALKIVRAAWPKDSKSLRGSLITALARIFKASDKVDRDRLAKILAPKSFVELTAHAEAFRKLSGGSADTVLARTIAELYNRGLSTNIIYFGETA